MIAATLSVHGFFWSSPDLTYNGKDGYISYMDFPSQSQEEVILDWLLDRYCEKHDIGVTNLEYERARRFEQNHLWVYTLLGAVKKSPAISFDMSARILKSL